VPVKRVGKANVMVASIVANPGGMYDGIPRFHADGKGRSGRGGGLTKQQQLEYKMQVEQAKIARNQERLQALRDKLNRQNELDQEESEQSRRVLNLENELMAQRRRNDEVQRQFEAFQRSAEFQLFRQFMQQRGAAGLPQNQGLPDNAIRDAEMQHENSLSQASNQDIPDPD